MEQARMPDARFSLFRNGLLFVAISALVALVVLVARTAPASAQTSDYLMCGWKVDARPQTVSIDPDLSAAGLTYYDVMAAFQPWNALFSKYHGFPIFVAYEGNWWEADILLTAHGWNTTWVQGRCDPSYVQRGNNHSVVFVGGADAWRNRSMLAHELGHALGLADHGDAVAHTGGHIGFRQCSSYYGVMSYCAGPQTWFLDYDMSGQGITLDGQLIQGYWWP